MRRISNGGHGAGSSASWMRRWNSGRSGRVPGTAKSNLNFLSEADIGGSNRFRLLKHLAQHGAGDRPWPTQQSAANAGVTFPALHITTIQLDQEKMLCLLN
jgi:hypothetical protein